MGGMVSLQVGRLVGVEELSIRIFVYRVPRPFNHLLRALVGTWARRKR